jgi:molybdopterin-guanine dinucleotide biosynthesis protein A
VFLPVDMPLMPALLLRDLLERAMVTDAPVTVATVGGVLQPFPVVLDRAVLPSIGQRLNLRLTACHQAWKTIPGDLDGFLDAVPVESLRQCGQCEHPRCLPPLYWFQGANTPAELFRLERMASERVRRHPMKSLGTM